MRTIHIESLGLQTIDENGNRSPMVEFMLSVLGAISKEWVKSGLNHAKAKGKVLGRPKNSIMDQQDFLKKYKTLSADL